MALDVALDIGTSNTRLATTERGVVFDEPTMVAIDTNSGRVVEVGHGALEMVARTPRHVVVFRPLAQGATVDFDVTSRLIAGLFDRAGVSKMSRARVVMSVPSLATSIERRALRQAAIQAGAREATLDRSADRRGDRHGTAGAGPGRFGGDGPRRRRVARPRSSLWVASSRGARDASVAMTSTRRSRRRCGSNSASSSRRR